MGSKTRKKDRKARQQRQLKRKVEQRQRMVGIGEPGKQLAVDLAIRQQRLARMKPASWEGEDIPDAAVFDDSTLDSLSPELLTQACAVREALQLACDSRGEAALKRLSDIPRTSPYSEWRLYLRGLVPWMAADAVAAQDAWKRLDPNRRPGRIAKVMLASLRTDLEHVSLEKSHESCEARTDAGSLPELDAKQLYHAKLLRRVRFDRAAIRVAKANLRMPEESKELLLGPRRIAWLKDFALEYRSTEPELVARLEQVALHRAFAQPYEDLFEMAAKSFVGPSHDRKNRLLVFMYFVGNEDARLLGKAERSLGQYLKKDLPYNQEITASLRDAITSQVHLNEAKAEMKPSGMGGMLAIVFNERENETVVREHLKASVQAYPAHRLAYTTHADWIESKLDDDRQTKAEQAPLLAELSAVMADWSRNIPDDVEPRLWLVNYLLENEQMDAAKPHVDWLASSRQDDPRVRATPWKWQLLKAMRLCRRKVGLPIVAERLQSAESQWPQWLSSQWLAYLKAAFLLRCGQMKEFERQRQQICRDSGVERDSLSDACMMLAAAQKMSVASSDLKPLRIPVDAAVKAIKALSYEELLAAGSFFWDLQRTQLLYPAYRMHGGKFAKEMWNRFLKKPSHVLEHLDAPQVQTAVLWCSEHRFFCNGYDLNFPKWFESVKVNSHPMFAAAKANAVLKLRSVWKASSYKGLVSLLREAAPSQRNPYYRYWFASLANELEEVVANQSSSGGFPFGNLFGEADFDPNCNCPDCQAARQASKTRI